MAKAPAKKVAKKAIEKEEEVIEEEATDEEVEEEVEADEEEVEEEIEEQDASATSTKFAVYQDGRLVKIFNSVTHGKDYKKIAKGLADRLQEKTPTSTFTAKAFVDIQEPEPEKDVVRIVNASNSLIREYSLSAHGKDYEKIAHAFLEKHGVKRGYRVG